jgi:hypothetical protein
MPPLPRTLLGDWSPGIGDPTPMGFLTVFAYFAAAVACFRARRRAQGLGAAVARERRVARLWLALGVFLVALGINKQLDLQTALTEIGRYLAVSRGWYERRREVQAEFIGWVAGAALTLGLALAFAARGQLRRLAMACAGALFLLTFVLVRASSFHHVDVMIHTRLAGLEMNWILELSGIALVGIAALRDRPSEASRPKPRRLEGRLL